MWPVREARRPQLQMASTWVCVGGCAGQMALFLNRMKVLHLTALLTAYAVLPKREPRGGVPRGAPSY